MGDSTRREVNCESLAGWLEAIVSKKKEGRVLVLADDPKARCIGFEVVGTGEWYYLTLRQFRESADHARKSAALTSIGITESEWRDAMANPALRQSILRRPLGF